ncbi:hypothetical protein XELAEV_18006994mg [Xenopus laevis]|uniref:Uncharacterized protein n=1 Tax=Xenopus laevis TaxID=8355 RepID=A0A974E0U6_XENLA|nr:hypothetical protein XELAEV_18006994mg [Xenopus laevis]
MWNRLSDAFVSHFPQQDPTPAAGGQCPWSEEEESDCLISKLPHASPSPHCQPLYTNANEQRVPFAICRTQPPLSLYRTSSSTLLIKISFIARIAAAAAGQMSA